jgi:hypothetical protein
LVADNRATSGTPELRAGDLVRTGEHSFPRYRIIATSGDRAWIQDAQDGTDHVVPVVRCHRL